MAYTTMTGGLASPGRAGLPRGALDGVRRRRILAVAVDLLAVSILVAVLWSALVVLTFGFALLILPPLFPAVAFFYNGVSVSGPAMATPGMRLCGIQLRIDATGARVPFIQAALHAVLFYFSWTVPPILLASLVTPEKRCLHDILSGAVVVRAL